MKYILMVLCCFALIGCATKPLGIVELEGGVKAEKTEHTFIGITWYTYKVIENAFKQTSDFLFTSGKYVALGGLALLLISATLFFSSKNPALQGFVTAGIVGGVLAFFAGIIACLISNVWILGIILTTFVLLLATGGYWLWKTRNFSVVSSGKQVITKLIPKKACDNSLG